MPRKDDEWMPWYIGRYLGDTMHLSYDQHGPYSFLLMHYWRKGPLPDDDTQLAAIAKVPPLKWKRMSSVIRAFFYVGDDGMLHQKRSDEERERRAEISAKRSVAGRAGVEAKAGLNSQFQPNDREANASGLLDVCGTQVQKQVQEEVPPSPSGKSPQREKSLGSRLPEDWRPPDEDRQIAVDLGLDPEAVLAMFRDYWLAKPGKEGRKADWPATWRNWCRRDAERKKSNRPGPAELPFLTPIAGGKEAAASDPNDHWGVDAWCKSHPGMEPITAKDATERVPLDALLAKGKWKYGGKLIDRTARQVAEAAGWNHSWRGDWSVLAQWIDEGISTTDHIIPTVHRMSEWFRSKGQPATTLRAFDKAIRERKAAA